MRIGIALGSNQGDRLDHLRAAVIWLEKFCFQKIKTSCVYETQPVDCLPGAPLFLNAVCEISYGSNLLKLFRAMRGFERQRGRPFQYVQNAPRPLDMDMLYAGDLMMATQELTLPHPRMLIRSFVLKPLCDIAPDLVVPGATQSVRELLASLSGSEEVKLYKKDLGRDDHP